MNQQPMLEQTDTLYALATSSDALYAARASGLYRSRDGGVTWQNTFAALDQPQPLAAVAVVAWDNTVFAGVNGAVLRSQDSGETWAVTPLASPPPLVVALALSPHFADDGTLFAGTTEDGVFVSNDRGESWVPWNFGLIDKSVYGLAVSPGFEHDETVFAGTQTGVFISRTGGRGWRDLPFPEDAAPVQCLHIAPNGTLFAGTEAHGLYASADNGGSWKRLSPDIFPAGIQSIQTAPDVGVLTENALQRSSDAGQTWQSAADFNADSAAMALTPLPHAGAWLVGFADGQIVQASGGS